MSAADSIDRDEELAEIKSDRSASSAASGLKSKILIYGINYAPEMAGVGKYTGELAEYFAASGAEVTVVTAPPHYPGWKIQKGFRNSYSTSIENGVRVIRSPLMLRKKMQGIWRLLAPLTFSLSSWPVAIWQIIKRRPDVIICVEPTLFSAPIAQIVGKLIGSRTVLHVQDLEVDAAFAIGHLGSKAWAKKLGFTFERLALLNFDKVITISNKMAERLRLKGVSPGKLAVIRNWVDLNHIYPTQGENAYRAELGFSGHDYVVLYSGNIGAKQGLNVLLDAAEQLSSDNRIHFVIAGEGPLKDQLVERYGHLPNIKFLTFQPYSRFNEFLNMPDLHVLPQDRGAADLVLPSKLGGMLASGRDILVTADDGTELADFVTGAAFVIPPGDAKAIAESIRQRLVEPRNASGVTASVCRLLEKETCLKQFRMNILS